MDSHDTSKTDSEGPDTEQAEPCAAEPSLARDQLQEEKEWLDDGGTGDLMPEIFLDLGISRTEECLVREEHCIHDDAETNELKSDSSMEKEKEKDGSNAPGESEAETAAARARQSMFNHKFNHKFNNEFVGQFRAKLAETLAEEFDEDTINDFWADFMEEMVRENDFERVVNKESPHGERSAELLVEMMQPWTEFESAGVGVADIPAWSSQHTVSKTLNLHEDTHEGCGYADPRLTCHQPASSADRRRASGYATPDLRSQTRLSSPEGKIHDDLLPRYGESASSSVNLEISVNDAVDTDIDNTDAVENAPEAEPSISMLDEQQLTGEEDLPGPKSEALEEPTTLAQISEVQSPRDDPLTLLKEPHSPKEPLAPTEEPAAPGEYLPKLESQPTEDSFEEELRRVKDFLVPLLGLLFLASIIGTGPSRLDLGNKLSEEKYIESRTDHMRSNGGQDFFKRIPQNGRFTRGEPIEEDPGVRLQQGPENPSTSTETMSEQWVDGTKGSGLPSLVRIVLMDQVNAWLDLLNLLDIIRENALVWCIAGYQTIRHMSNPEYNRETRKARPIALKSRQTVYILVVYFVVVIHLYVLMGLRRERHIWTQANRTTRRYLLGRIHRYGAGRQPFWMDWDLAWSPRELVEVVTKVVAKGVTLLREGIEALISWFWFWFWFPSLEGETFQECGYSVPFA